MTHSQDSQSARAAYASRTSLARYNDAKSDAEIERRIAAIESAASGMNVPLNQGQRNIIAKLRSQMSAAR